MTARIKLPDAIAGNRNGLERLRERRESMRQQADQLLAGIRVIDREIVVRVNMMNAMQELQDLMPDNETIQFLVPE
jgi:hypothetical protein